MYNGMFINVQIAKSPRDQKSLEREEAQHLVDARVKPFERWGIDLIGRLPATPNGTLGRMLTKYLVGKPTRSWDEYLPQALFATRVRLHAVTKISPFYLLYGFHPRIPSDTNGGANSEEKASTADCLVGAQQLEGMEDRIGRVNHVRALANELLLNRAIRTKRIRDQLVKETRFEPGTWVLVRNEGPEKFQPCCY
ncbi:hypothetical protein VTO42DRAFT_6966 [Malbranchea cinnamomea]